MTCCTCPRRLLAGFGAIVGVRGQSGCIRRAFGAPSQVIRRRLNNYKAQATPVEDFFKHRGVLLDFEITSGIPETLPRLLDAVRPHCGNWKLADVND